MIPYNRRTGDQATLMGRKWEYKLSGIIGKVINLN
jgi:hypothetical protein